MSIGHEYLGEFDDEMAATRKVLERVPTEKGEWKPHPKSFSLAHLAQLVSWMPGWITNSLTQTELNLQGGAGYSNESTATLLDLLDKNVREAHAAIAAASDAD